MTLTTMNPPAAVVRILEAITRSGGRPLLVGGAVRDAVAGAETKDFDVEVYGLEVDPLVEVLRPLGHANLVGKSFGVIKVAVDGLEVDVALPRRESKEGRGHRGFMVSPDPTMTPREAAMRRDFTINAMAFDPVSREVLDYFGGVDDLRAGVLRHVGPAFAEDPLRVLRGMQFAARFGLRATEETLLLCRQLLVESETLAIERVWTEWWKWASKATRPSLGLEFLSASGWREAIPELVALDGCRQEPEWHPEGDVWTHTLLVSDAAARIAAREALGPTERGVLMLAALCHDLGKPETTVVEDGRLRSPGHADCEATYRSFLDRIGCPASIADRVVVLCRRHLAHMGFAGSKRHVRRLARSLGQGGETIEMLARLVEADHSGRHPLPGGMPAPMEQMQTIARELAVIDAMPEPLLGGRHLIERGIEPGPEMGRLLKAAYEVQLDGAFATLDEALRWIDAELQREANE